MVTQIDASEGVIVPDATVSFHPKTKMVRFRKAYAPVLLLMSVINFGWAAFMVFGMSTRLWPIALMNVATGVGVLFIYRWFRAQTFADRVRPVLMLGPDGITLDGSPTFGTLAWEDIATVRPSHFLGIPHLCIVPRDWNAMKRRPGTRGGILWLCWIPGGIGLNCVPFGIAPADLAARILRYRERGL